MDSEMVMSMGHGEPTPNLRVHLEDLPTPKGYGGAPTGAEYLYGCLSETFSGEKERRNCENST